jgi:hypothetical protein
LVSLPFEDNVSALLADLNGDGFLDLAVSEQYRPMIALGDGKMNFTALSSVESGMKAARSGACTIDAVDLNGDGQLELVALNGRKKLKARSGAVVLYRSTTAIPGLTLELETITEPVHGLGARVSLQAGDFIQHRQVRSIGNPWSSRVPPLHFGVGNAEGPFDVKIIWPSGHRQSVTIPSAGQAWVLREGAKHVNARLH